MERFPKIAYLLILFFNICYSISSQNALTDSGITKKVICQHDSSQKYAVFIPSSYVVNRPFPVIFFYEPAARALLPLEKYQSYAEKYSYIMACSYNSRNGPNEPIFEAANAMWTDCFNRLNLDTGRVCLAGFSGGSRIASLIALSSRKIDYVIGCGAGFPYENFPEEKTSFEYLGIIGKQDMNFQEMMLLDSALKRHQQNTMLITFDQGHQWPPATTFEHAFYWLETNFMKTGKKPIDSSFVKEIYDTYKPLIKDKNFENRLRKLNNLIILLDPLVNLDNCKKLLSELTTSTDYKLLQEKKKKIKKTEVLLQRRYINEFEQISLTSIKPDHPVKSQVWWKKEFHKITKLEDPDLRARLKEFIINGSWEQHQNSKRVQHYETALQYLKIYEAGLPESSEPDYLFAVVFALMDNQTACFRHLQRAVRKGFHDEERLRSEAAFIPYHKLSKFEKILYTVSEPGY